MSRDVLLYGMSESLSAAALGVWAQTTSGLHPFVPDYHRLQLEYWIWTQRDALGARILDIGVDHPRRWLGDGYLTCGEHHEDIRGDVLALPFPSDAFSGVILTEVLEHCLEPRAAVAEVWRVLEPGGLLLVTSPFLWPDHRTDEYRDYWRFTEQGWEALLQAFTNVRIVPCEWTPEGETAYHLMRRFECWGFSRFVKATTGYLCSARKPA